MHFTGLHEIKHLVPISTKSTQYNIFYSCLKKKKKHKTFQKNSSKLEQEQSSAKMNCERKSWNTTSLVNAILPADKQKHYKNSRENNSKVTQYIRHPTSDIRQHLIEDDSDRDKIDDFIYMKTRFPYSDKPTTYTQL